MEAAAVALSEVESLSSKKRGRLIPGVKDVVGMIACPCNSFSPIIAFFVFGFY
jgi:hypothetical protein